MPRVTPACPVLGDGGEAAAWWPGFVSAVESTVPVERGLQRGGHRPGDRRGRPLVGPEMEAAML